MIINLLLGLMFFLLGLAQVYTFYEKGYIVWRSGYKFYGAPALISSILLVIFGFLFVIYYFYSISKYSKLFETTCLKCDILKINKFIGTVKSITLSCEDGQILEFFPNTKASAILIGDSNIPNRFDLSIISGAGQAELTAENFIVTGTVRKSREEKERRGQPLKVE